MERIELEDLPEDVQEELEMLTIPGTESRESLTAMRAIAKRFPGFVLARLNCAAFQLNAGDTSGAEWTYQRILDDFPGEYSALGGLATVYAAQGDLGRAEQQAKESLAAGYEWSPLYAVIGKTREAAGDIPAATEAYLKAYQLWPHDWETLESYCRLQNRPYHSPLEELKSSPLFDQIGSLFPYVDTAAHAPDATGEMPGCNHTFRFTEKWAAENEVDIIELYQVLNAYGGFCDCEVCFNVEPELYGDEDDYDDEEDDEDQ